MVEETEESSSWLGKYFLFGLIAILTVYGLLALIIYFVDITSSSHRGVLSKVLVLYRENMLVFSLEPTTMRVLNNEGSDSGCGMDSFMIRDGVCDEMTNTPACLFDGGDCCQHFQTKDTTLCKNCTCQLTIDMDKLRELFDTTGVRKVKQPASFLSLILAATHVAQETVSVEVCSTLCLKEDLVPLETINGWMYNSEVRICTCAWLKSAECNRMPDFIQLSEPWNQWIDSNTSDIAFMQTAKTMDCSTNIDILLL